MLAFADMMKKGIVMPAHLVDDGLHEQRNKGANLFQVDSPGSGAC
jgi:acyl-[acyl-carrier-protein] desaturase